MTLRDNKNMPHEPRHTPKERPGPVGGKRDANRRERTRVLSEAALALFLEKGVEGVTIDDIVQRADVAKGSFYRYFDDKTELVEAVLLPLERLVREAFESCDRDLSAAGSIPELYEGYQRFGTRMAGAVLEYPDVARLYLQECRGPRIGSRAPISDLATEIVERALRLTDAAKTHGLLRPLDPRVTALATVGAVERMLFSFLSGEDFGDYQTASQSLISMVLHGMLAGPGKD